MGPDLMWEPRPRGDDLLNTPETIAARAPLLQEHHV